MKTTKLKLTEVKLKETPQVKKYNEALKKAEEKLLEEVERHDSVNCFFHPQLCKEWGCKCKCHV